MRKSFRKGRARIRRELGRRRKLSETYGWHADRDHGLVGKGSWEPVVSGMRTRNSKVAGCGFQENAEVDRERIESSPRSVRRSCSTVEQAAPELISPFETGL